MKAAVKAVVKAVVIAVLAAVLAAGLIAALVTVLAAGQQCMPSTSAAVYAVVDGVQRHLDIVAHASLFKNARAVRTIWWSSQIRT